MSENLTTEENIQQPKKRGRKPKVDKNYFGVEEEQAFQEYLLSTDPSFRERIFAKKLKPAFTKMIESIIRRYNLFTPYEEFDDTFNDAMSFLTTKMDKFKPGKEKKAYSYCGTICKNYLINKRLTTMKRDNKFLSYDTVYTESNPDNRVETDFSPHENFVKSLLNRAIVNTNDTIEEGFWDDGTPLSENEKKVGYAIIQILSNWEEIFELGETCKFNKTSVFYFIKENTMLSTKEVKDALKKYKMDYSTMKSGFVSKN